MVGGGMAFTFLAAQGHTVGASLLDKVRLADCRALLQAAGGRVFLPSDVVALAPGGEVGEGATGTGELRVMGVELPPGWRGLDIGPGTAAAYTDAIEGAGTVFWNGPMGVFEDDRFAAGTRSVAEALASSRASPSSAAAIRCPPSTHRCGRSASTSCPPAAAPRSSSSSTATSRARGVAGRVQRPGGKRSSRRRPQAARRVREVLRMARKKTGRRMLVSGNWKMHHDHLHAIRTVQDLGLRLAADDVTALDVSVHPPFTDLRSVQTVIEDRAIPVSLGAQHCFNEDVGAFTGEVAPPMLARLGVSYVIVGHSERRQFFHRAMRMSPSRCGPSCATA